MNGLGITSCYTLKDKALLILMGIFVFSTFTARLSMALHFPLTLPEPFFFLFLILLKKHFLPINIDKDLFFVLSFVLVLLIILSQLTSDYPLYAVLSSSRGYLYLFLFLCVFKRKNKLLSDDILYITFGTLIGWLISSLMAFKTLLFNPDDPVQTNGNMIAVVLFISTAILNEKWRVFVIGFALLLVISFTAGIRRLILVIVVATLLTALIYLLKRKISIIRVSFITLLFLIPFVFAIHFIDTYLEENVPVLHYRLFTKTEELFKGEYGESDDNRVGFIKTFNDNLESYILPQGMVSNQYLDDDKIGIFMDFPFLALSHIFSFPVAFSIVMFFIFQAYKSYLLFRKTSDPSPGIYSIATIVMCFLLFVEGTFIVHPFTTPFTGLCLGKIIYYSKKYNLQMGLKSKGRKIPCL